MIYVDDDRIYIGGRMCCMEIIDSRFYLMNTEPMISLNIAERFLNVNFLFYVDRIYVELIVNEQIHEEIRNRNMNTRFGIGWYKIVIFVYYYNYLEYILYESIARNVSQC